MKNPLLLPIALSLFLCATSTLLAQDTLSIYFETGSHKLQATELKKLDAIPNKYWLTNLADIQYIGMADSVGNMRNNLILSEKRAKAVAKYCKPSINTNTPVSIAARGEQNNLADARRNRRVDIIFNYQQETSSTGQQESDITTIPDPAPSLEDTIAIETEAPAPVKTKRDLIKGCFYIDYNILSQSRITEITYRKKPHILIENHSRKMKYVKHFYREYNPKTESYQLKRVKWKTRTTGESWNRKSRKTATIPKEAYEKNKIFTIKTDTTQCDDCNTNPLALSKPGREIECMQVDSFLMANIQYKIKFVKGSFVKIRAPREFVNLKDNYFTDCSYYKVLNWQTKKIGKKKRYYFSTLMIKPTGLSNISREMPCCAAKPEPCKPSAKMTYFLDRFKGPSQKLKFNVELGYNFRKNTHNPYLGIGLNKYWGTRGKGYNYLNFVAGTDLDLGFYSSADYDRLLLFFPLNISKSANSWQAVDKYKQATFYGTAYLGTGLKFYYHETGNFLEQNVHIGLAAIKAYPKNFNRFYVNFGLGYDYLNEDRKVFYPIVHTGIVLKLFNF